jgi:hypothetical protein
LAGIVTPALAGVPPACCDTKVAGVPVHLATVALGDVSDGPQLVAHVAGGYALNRRFDIEKRSNPTAEVGRGKQSIGRDPEGNAGPVLA